MAGTTEIVQGHDDVLPSAGAHVVIDVIRAFTVAQVAFMRGVREIWLARDVDAARQMHQRHPETLLAGEIAGLPIADFHLDNSPATMDAATVAGRTLIQMTTNGVQAALNAMQAEHVFVTGFANAARTACHLRALRSTLRDPRIRLVASHPSSDDDLACAEYMAGILQGDGQPQADEVRRRIRRSDVAQKFLDPQRPEFPVADLEWCAREIPVSFVMRVIQPGDTPIIVREEVL